MEDNRLLFKDFENYYKMGIAALQNNEYSEARRSILAAAEAILNLAKNSTGVVKAERLKSANELYDIANKIEQKQGNVIANSSANYESIIARIQV